MRLSFVMRPEKIFTYQIIFKKDFQKNISFIIGPEGGFSNDEIKKVYNSPFLNRVRIHDRILRAETAAVLVMSIYKNFLQLLE